MKGKRSSAQGTRERWGIYGGLSIDEGKIEGSAFKIRDPETGEWKKLE